jgi:hypothetical protein
MTIKTMYMCAGAVGLDRGLAQNQIDYLVVHKLDRWVRNPGLTSYFTFASVKRRSPCLGQRKHR